MCIGIPGRICEIDGWKATAEVGRSSREINTMLLDGLAPGDWVVIHAGYAISRIDADEAERLLSYLERL